MCGTRACPCQAPPSAALGSGQRAETAPAGLCFSTRRMPRRPRRPRMPTQTIDNRRTHPSARPHPPSPTSASLLLAAALGPPCSTRRLGSLDPRPLRQGTRIAPPRLGDDSGAGRWALASTVQVGTQQVSRYYRLPTQVCALPWWVLRHTAARKRRKRRKRRRLWARGARCEVPLPNGVPSVALGRWDGDTSAAIAAIRPHAAHPLPVRCPSHGLTPAMAVTHTTPTCCHHRWAPSPPARSLTCCRRRPLAVPRLPLPLNACCAPSASAPRRLSLPSQSAVGGGTIKIDVRPVGSPDPLSGHSASSVSDLLSFRSSLVARLVPATTAWPLRRLEPVDTRATIRPF
jgi:hypothetical protein